MPWASTRLGLDVRIRDRDQDSGRHCKLEEALTGSVSRHRAPWPPSTITNGGVGLR
jgi:hypothetical protein